MDLLHVGRKSDMLSVQMDGLHMEHDHFVIAGFQQRKQNMIQRTCRVYFANLVGVNIEKGGRDHRVFIAALSPYRRRHGPFG
jgi:hypothetical protein